MLASIYKNAVLIWLSSIIIIIFAQCNANNQCEKLAIESLNRHFSNIRNNKQLHDAFNKVFIEFNVRDKQTVAIIKQVFTAKLISSKTDRLNNNSSSNYLKAIAGATALKRKDLQLWTQLEYGFYLYNFRQMEKTFPYLMFCVKNFDEIQDKDVIDVSETGLRIGYYLITLGDNEKASQYLLRAKKYANNDPKKLAAITNALGLCAFNMSDLKNAKLYYHAAKIQAKASGDSLRYAKTLGYLGEISLLEKKFDSAVKLFNEDLEISRAQKNIANTIFTLIRLSKAYLGKNNIAQAERNLKEAADLAKTKTYLRSFDYEINALVLQLAQKTNNGIEELKARRISDSLSLLLDKSDSKEIITKMGWNTEKNILALKIENEKAQREKESIIKIGALICCVLLMISIFFIVRNYNNKIRVEKTNFENKLLSLRLDKANSENKLKRTKRTLEDYKVYLQEKNGQIYSLENEISNAKKTSSDYANDYSSQIRSLLDSHLLCNENWLDFKELFLKSDPLYSKHLMQKFPDLTDANLRIIFLIKLGMSNLEISRILGLTLDAVKKNKQRLKKKYADKYYDIFGISSETAELNSLIS